MAGEIEVKVPDIGDFDEVDVVEVLVAVGDEVGKDQSLITLESDKASMEVPSTAAGRVAAVHVSVGDHVAAGTVIATVEPDRRTDATDAEEQSDEGAREDESQPPTEPEQDHEQAARAVDEEPSAATPGSAAPGATEPGSTEPFDEAIYASPSVRKRARELDVDLSNVQGSGRKGRILREDVERLAAAGAAPRDDSGGVIPPVPAVDHGEFGEVEVEALTRINRLTGRSVLRSWLNVPHVTQFDEADITDLDGFRRARKADAEARGVKLTFVSFLLAAVAATLREYPRFNSSLARDGESIVVKKYVNLGVAVDTPQGLVVPVIRDVPNKRLYDLAAELAQVSSRARDGKLRPDDIQGGTFTISSLGGIGGTAFTPIVNAPEVAILGVSRARMQPIWTDGEFVPRLMLPLALSYDHRVIDGAMAARFTQHLAGMLADIRDMLL